MAPSSLELVGRLAASVGLGLVVGLERKLRTAAAGDRTFALLAMGAAAFTIAGENFPGETGKVIAGVATAVGFIGAGLVWRDKHPNQIHGLTTATAAWCCVAVGVLAGVGLLAVAVATTALMLGILEWPHLPLFRRIGLTRFLGRFRVEDDRTGQPAKRVDPEGSDRPE